MATDVRTTSVAISDDATFRAFIQTVRASLLAVGMVQATDAGQIDPATATKPVATSTDAGVEYWHLPGNPAQLRGANGQPYLTVGYGTHSVATTARVHFRQTYGSVSGDALSSSVSVMGGVIYPAPAASYTIYTQADVSGFRMIWACTTGTGTSSGGGITWEKPKEVDGVVTTELIMAMTYFFGGNNGAVQLIEKNSTVYTTRTLVEAGVANLGAPVGSTNGATDLALEPLAITYRGKWLFLGNMFGATNDIGGAAVFDFSWLDYIHFRSIPTLVMFSALPASSSSVCIPWS